MKIKLIVMITLLIQLVCMSVAWAESEDLSEMDKQAGGGGAGTMICRSMASANIIPGPIWQRSKGRPLLPVSPVP